MQSQMLLERGFPAGSNVLAGRMHNTLITATIKAVGSLPFDVTLLIGRERLG
jgi:hypothetical protein